MAITVQLYAFAKRHNSTKRPTSASVSFSCELKEGCSILYPSIGISNGAAWNPASYNYAQIASFNRYYYISDWSFEGGLWWATMTVDFLATWRTEIYSSYQYVLRSSVTFDGSIIDELYQGKTTYSFHMHGWSGADQTGTPWAQTLDNGIYIIGIINSDSAAVGAVSYYLFTPAQFSAFKAYMLGSLDWMEDQPTDITENLFKSLYNPFQYIVSIRWFPFGAASVLSKTEITTVKLGWWELTPLSAYTFNVPFVDFNNNLSIQSHHLAPTRGKYLNRAPYTVYRLFAPPFGIFDIESNLAGDLLFTAGLSPLSIQIRVDLISGKAHLTVYGTHQDLVSRQIELLSVETQLSIDIQLAQIYSQNDSGDFLNTVTQGLENVVTGAKNLLTGKSYSAEGVKAQIGVGDALAVGSTTLMQLGSNGSLSQFYLPFMVYSIHADMVDDDADDRGRPLCQIMQLSSISNGYAIVQDSHISIPSTDYEIQAVNAALEGGVFLE